MQNMWSDKKYINILINVMVFLVSLNIFHYGQLLLPIICLIIFIDNKLNFKVNSMFSFVLLCLFAVSFCAFSYKSGFYCTMGFCLPMAYYIGSNLKENKAENCKKVLSIIIMGMLSHVILNIGYDYYIYGIKLFQKQLHYDFWLKTTITATNLTSDILLILSIIYYLINYEKNKKHKFFGLFLFFIAVLYDIALGRRTPLFVFFISFVISIFFDFFVFKNRKSNKKINLIIVVTTVFVILIIAIIMRFNLFSIGDRLIKLTIVEKIANDGFDPKRIDIFLESLQYFFKYPWGGQLISEQVGVQIHDIWFDIYDYAGIVPFIFMIVYSLAIIRKFFIIIKDKSITKDIKILIAEIYTCIGMVMFIEPVMTSLSIFLICSIIIITSFEDLTKEKK